MSLFLPKMALNPGPLSAGHGTLADQCLRCHTLGRGTPPAKCLVCHAFEEIGIKRRDEGSRPPRRELAAMHRTFSGIACGECHSDHAGPERSAATLPFSHDSMNSDLRRRCVACHDTGRPADALHRVSEDDCASCHDVRAWTPATFVHERYFVLDRDHNPRCTICHDRPGDYGAYTCYGCHEHTPTHMESKHSKEGIRDFEDCARCHRSAVEREGHDGGEGRKHDDRSGRSGEEDGDD